MNPTVGDFSGNARKIRQWIQSAERKKADLIVFPEMALCGYPIWDLANKESFLEENNKRLEGIIRLTKRKKITVVLGCLQASSKGDDRSFNALAVIAKGKLIGLQPKRLLPTYDVFLENIFFQSGKTSHIFSFKGRRLGLTVCEDIWDENYREKPLRELAKKRADLFVNSSASPYYRDVSIRRMELVRKQAIRYRTPLLYVNQVGAQDDLIFDGRSFFVDASGRILYRAPAFKEGVFYYDWNPKKKDPFSWPAVETTSVEEEMYEALKLGIRDYCRKNGFSKVLIGLSGGIDSALTAALAVDALGSKAVLGVTMPGTYSSKGSWQDSERLAKNLKIKFCVHPIREKYRFMIKEFRKQDPNKRRNGAKSKKVTLAMENLQARLRGMELMYLSNDQGRLLLSTGNKSELAVGYCTLYGDMAGGLAVLGDVYKTDVYRLAWYRNRQSPVIPESILSKAPSAELRPEQKDQDSLPAYDILDEILYLYIEKNQSRDEIIRNLSARNVSVHTVIDTIRKVDHNEYKRRQTPPILRVTEKAWFGRRMPITNRFDR